MGRVQAPDLYRQAGPTPCCSSCPGRVAERAGGEVLRAVIAAGAFAAFMSTTSGLLVAVAGALAHDLYARSLRPQADQRRAALAFRLAALGAGAFAVAHRAGRRAIPDQHARRLGVRDLGERLFPLLVLGIWWRGLTVAGAAAGTLPAAGWRRRRSPTRCGRRSDTARYPPGHVCSPSRRSGAFPLVRVMVAVSLLTPADAPPTST